MLAFGTSGPCKSALAVACSLSVSCARGDRVVEAPREARTVAVADSVRLPAVSPGFAPVQCIDSLRKEPLTYRGMGSLTLGSSLDSLRAVCVESRDTAIGGSPALILADSGFVIHVLTGGAGTVEELRLISGANLTDSGIGIGATRRAIEERYVDIEYLVCDSWAPQPHGGTGILAAILAGDYVFSFRYCRGSGSPSPPAADVTDRVVRISIAGNH